MRINPLTGSWRRWTHPVSQQLHAPSERDNVMSYESGFIVTEFATGKG